MKYWKSYPSDPSAIATSILLGFVGLTAIGCSSPAISNVPQSTPAQSSATVNTGNGGTHPARSLDNGKEGKATEKVQVTLVNSANKSQDLPLQKGMTYEEARQIILAQGWKPNPNVESNLRSPVVKAIFDRGYIEINDCSGTGEAPCRYEFVNQNGELLYVVTAGRDSLVRNWWIEKRSDASQQNSASNSIQSGRYWIGGTDQGLEIQAERYRYYDESGIDKPWKPISELKYIKDGVVFYDANHWCLSTLMPKNRVSTCTANGWMTRETLPFIGTRRFNFLGGSGTGQSITIEQNGNTVVQIHGTAGSSVIYRGNFSNPIVLEDGRKLLLEADKIYSLGLGQSAQDCKSSGSPCEAKLY
ncbi:hypothetical protein V2H45_13240 [Tumidithrix elongata RA019]|uniref:Lipoprotein n=1 Tax=Tumidithrix elongata BACA0141 TaxID=2716417 RepID=A0AAW9PS21_9CYAN|nr:hypothetical protein [Tumidithrix elongata RA019]